MKILDISKKFLTDWSKMLLLHGGPYWGPIRIQFDNTDVFALLGHYSSALCPKISVEEHHSDGSYNVR